MNASVVAADPRPDKVAWWRSARARLAFKLALLAIVTLIAMVYRQPDQFRVPTLWVEDGVINIPDYLASGWWSLFHPIAGYFVLPIKFLHALAQTLSFRWLPEIGVCLVVLFTYGVLAAIATSPTTFRVPFLFAAAPLAIPSSPEVFAISLYAGWWGTLLALPPLFWRQDGKPRLVRRCSMLVLGGLSSPFIIFLIPLYALRTALYRNRNEYITMAICFAVATVQAIQIVKHRSGGGTPAVDLILVVEKFFGHYLVQLTTPGLGVYVVYIGMCLLVFIATIWICYRRELGFTFVLLAGTLAIAIVSSLARVPIELIHPLSAGQRYFFFPYVALSWVLLQIATLNRDMPRVLAAFVLGLGGRNALEVARHRHEAIDWRGNIEQCLNSPTHSLPVHFTGQATHYWFVPLTNADCKELVQRSWFDNKIPQ